MFEPQDHPLLIDPAWEQGLELPVNLLAFLHLDQGFSTLALIYISGHIIIEVAGMCVVGFIAACLASAH